MKWSEFSFMLKPSSLGGVGVFAVHDIPAGTLLFNKNFELRTMKIADVPEALRRYCIYTSDTECLCPERFDRMEIGWYINHSDTPNIAKKIDDQNPDLPASVDSIKARTVYAIKDIKSGDEILIDYNYLNEPEHLKEDYYK
ncbi:SET domain-containing protein [Candidatus Babeliales bacterium]|nr:SET domain-containing protein [Candidatus Babeliales bacterium]